MILNGISGKGTGKLGSNVYSVSGGEQIVRQYNPNVTNPNTEAQVSQRSRFKLATQIAAALSPVIAIPKQGLKSSRNLFVKRNNESFVTTEEGAECAYSTLQLTSGSAGLPAVEVNYGGSVSTPTTIALAEDASQSASRVVYSIFKVTTEQQLMLISSLVVNAAGEAGTFPTSIALEAGNYVVYAYGMRDNNSSAAANYGNYGVQTGEDIARLVANRKLSASDYSFTKTQGLLVGGGLPEFTFISLTASNGFGQSVGWDETDIIDDEVSINGVITGTIARLVLEFAGSDDNLNIRASYYTQASGTEIVTESFVHDGSGDYYLDVPASDADCPITLYINGVKWLEIVE